MGRIVRWADGTGLGTGFIAYAILKVCKSGYVKTCMGTGFILLLICSTGLETGCKPVLLLFYASSLGGVKYVLNISGTSMSACLH